MPKANILIVEDSFIVSYHLKATLENEDYQVVDVCDSGEQALEVVAQKKPDLVLMDIMLNGKMDGVEAASIIREAHHLPVIYITALTDKETIGRAKITEPFGYLTKPFEDREIFTVIEMALYKHRIESKLRESEQKYFSTVNSINDCVIAIDRECRITFMNASALNYQEGALQDFLGKEITNVIQLSSEETGEVNINPVQCMLGVGNMNSLPDYLLLTGKHGRQTPIGESSLSPLLDERGDMKGMIIVFKDITDKVLNRKLTLDLERQKLAALIEGQETERVRIAKDLHDGLGQMLNAIKMNVSMITSSPSEGENLSALLDEAIQESVRISENLVPSKLRDFDLQTCLRSLCNQVKNQTGSNVTFIGEQLSTKVAQSQKVNLYRITQEAISNSIKHAQPKSITVQLSEIENVLQLTVEDDGHGFFPEMVKGASGHHGLVNMRERTEIMGGIFGLETDPKRGTLISIQIPTPNLH